MAFKGPQDGVLFTPRRRRELRLKADVLEKLLSIHASISRHARQQQPPRIPASNLQAMLTDLHDVHAILTASTDKLLIRKQPYLDIEMRQLARRDGWKAMVVSRRAAGSMHDRMSEWHVLPQKTAAAAESATALGADERAEHSHFRGAGEIRRRELQFAAMSRGFQHASGAFDDGRLLIGSQLVQRCGRRRDRVFKSNRHGTTH